jgi:hypothetical protein
VAELSRAGFEVDVRGCRQMREGLHVLRARRRAGTLPRVVVVALGANWVIHMSEIRQALAILGRERVLGLVTPRESGGGSGSDAGVIRAAVRRYPNRVRVLDWVRYSAGHGGWFAGDGLHLGPGGARGLTRLLSRVLRLAPRVVPERGPWTGTGRSGPIAFSVGRRGSMTAPVIIADRSCFGAYRRVELGRIGVRRLTVGFDGGFGGTFRSRGRTITFRGRFVRRDRLKGVLRVRNRRGRRCDTGRVRWSAEPGRPDRRAGRWSGTDARGNALSFPVPEDLLSVGSYGRGGDFRGTLPVGCGSFSGGGVFSFRGPIPILEGSFSGRQRLRDGSILEVGGGFVGPDRAEGTWRWLYPSTPGGQPCDSGPVSWVASP